MNLLIALFAMLLSSCGQKAATVPVYPTQGKATYRGRPAAGARIVFYPLEPPAIAERVPQPQAEVEADGSFRLSTYLHHDGAPAGRYAVTIVWPSDARKEEDGTPIGPDRLGKKYANPAKSPLHASVEAGDNELPVWDLK